MRAFSLITCLLSCLLGCAAPKEVEKPNELATFVVGLERSGGFTGIEERFEVASDGTTRRSERFPGEESRILRERAIDSSKVEMLRAFLLRNKPFFDTLQLHESGNLTSAIDIKGEVYVRRFSWPNFDPPKLASPLLDSVYAMVFGLQGPDR